MLTNIQLLDFLLAILDQGDIKKKKKIQKKKDIQEMVHFCESLESHANVSSSRWCIKFIMLNVKLQLCATYQ